MKRGWWKVRIDVIVDGIGIDFDELSSENKKRIQAMLAQGCVAGEIEELDERDWTHWNNHRCKGKIQTLRVLRGGKK